MKNLTINKSIFFFSLFSLSLLIVDIRLTLLLLLFCICVLPLFFCKKDIFEPINWFNLWYFYFYGAGYCCYLVRSSIGITQRFDFKIELIGLLISLYVITIVNILFSYSSAPKKYIGIKNQNFIFIKYSLVLILLITIFNLSVSFLFWKQIGGIPLFIKNYHNTAKTELGKGLGYLEYLQSFLGLLVYFVMIGSQYQKKSKYLIYGLMFFNLGIIPLLSDNRSGVIGNLIIFMLFYDWNIVKIHIKKLVRVVVLLAVVASAWGVYRDGAKGSIIKMGYVILSEIGVEYDNYLDVLNMFPNEYEYQYGKTYIPCFTLLMPRAIMPNKNDYKTGGELFKYIKHHDYIRVGERFTFTGEVYMNFGIIGILTIAPIVLYLLLFFSEQLFLRGTKYSVNIKIQVLSYLIFSLLNGFLAGDSATAFTSNITGIIFVLMFFRFLTSIDKKEHKVT